ncbi:hypothetical protein GKE82_02780 [Conexibacter sp. W3-3-2]|nr:MULTISPECIES: hypothetical protein [Solirubrobacterales]MTD43258.1 hypothetical protein [Conexibacter sp. W3-3-2]
MYQLLGRITWKILKLVAPPLARKLQYRLTGEHPPRRSLLRRVTARGAR